MHRRSLSSLLVVATLATISASCSLGPEPAAKLAMLEAEEEGPRPEFPGEAAAWWAGLHEDPSGRTPAELNLEARREVERSALARGASNLPVVRFDEWGPGNFAGRLRGLVVKDGDPDQMLVGSVSGGVWKTTDGGESWAPSDDFLESLAVGSMLADPEDADTVWLGTGEGYFNVDAAQGNGIFKSVDFGDTWTQLASTTGSDFNYVNRIARIPGPNDVVIAATRAGLFRSANGGTSFTRVDGITTSSRGFTTVLLDPTSIDGSNDETDAVLIASHYGGSDASRRLYRSTDGGQNWQELDGSAGLGAGIPTTNIGRMEVDFGQDGTLYALAATSGSTTRGLFRSTDGGNSFTTASTHPVIERQGWYDLFVGVDPTDSDVVYMGAVDMYKTINGGTTVTQRTFWSPGAGQLPQYVHADQHLLVFDPNDVTGQTVLIGSDGGIFRSTDGGLTWNHLNNDLRITQYYGIAPHPDGERAQGGTQDNGAHLFFGDKVTWLEWNGGDGGYASWDQQNPDFLYNATPNGGLYGSGDGGASNQSLGGLSSASAPFITPFTLDPNDGNRMIVGTNRVQYSGNVRQLGTASFSFDSAVIGSVSALTVSPHDGDVAYAGTTAGQIWRTTALGTGAAWTRIDAAPLPGGSDVTWIEVDPHDGSGQTLYATFADYGGDRVFKSTTGGVSWFSIQGDFPQIPAFSLRVDPRDASSQSLWLGSELGLFTSDDAGSTWDHYDWGTAWTRVVQLHWVGLDVMWIGTHGRSIYRMHRSPAEVSIGDLSGESCAPGDGYLDPGETATLPVSLTNRSAATMESVSVDLESSWMGFSNDSGPLAYSNLAPGASESQNFTVTLGSIPGGSCLEFLPLDVIVQSNGAEASERIELLTGVEVTPQVGPLLEDGEDAATPFLSQAAIGVDDWGRVTSQAHTGSFSWFASDVASYADKSLLSPWMEVGGAATVLDFWIRYDLEGDLTQLWDGTVLELRVEGGEWVDIGNLSTVPYDGPLFDNNTIPGRDAWSGTQLTWRNGVVDLGSTYNGQRIQVRFRTVCDTGANNPGGGFWVDDLSITNVSWEELACDMFGCSLVFMDDFESGDTTAWSSAVP